MLLPGAGERKVHLRPLPLMPCHHFYTCCSCSLSAKDNLPGLLHAEPHTGRKWDTARFAFGFTTNSFFFFCLHSSSWVSMKNWVNKEPLLLHELVYKRFSFSPTSFHVVNKKVANLLIKKGNISVHIIPTAIFYMSVYTVRPSRARLCYASFHPLHITQCFA